MIEDNNNKDFILVEGSDIEVSVVRTGEPDKTPRRGGGYKRYIIVAVIVVVLMAILAIVGKMGYDYYYGLNVPISRTPQENIEILKYKMELKTHGRPRVTVSSDSILGVAMDFYRLDNLRATLSMTEPDSTDTSVYLYVRSSDFLADSTMLGSTVVNGHELPSHSDARYGYVAMAGKGVVVGVSRSDEVKDFVMDLDGSYFRQFVLVSNGVLPQVFHLHGKVERRALAVKDDQLYVVATRDKESIWDFADALREYGFVDAVYITGGNDRTYYRESRHKIHRMGTDSITVSHVPWLVFKK